MKKREKPKTSNQRKRKIKKFISTLTFAARVSFFTAACFVYLQLSFHHNQTEPFPDLANLSSLLGCVGVWALGLFVMTYRTIR